MKARHIVQSLILTLAFNAGAVPPAEAARKKQASDRPDRYASIVIDAESGKTLYERDGDQRLYPASTTKVMTAYLTFKALKEGKLKMDQKLTVSLHAAGQPRTNLAMLRQVTEKTVVKTKSGKKINKNKTYTKQVLKTITVRDALLSMLVHSANDAAVVLAEAVGNGSEKAFVRQMNAAADALGMANTHFANPNGLPNPTQKTTVEDMAKLCRAVIREFPEYYPLFNTPEYTFNGVHYSNYNKLLGNYPGADGIKTGWIAASGHNLTASARRDLDGDGHPERVIGVIFGAASSGQRLADMKNLLDKGFTLLAEQKTAQARPVPLPPATGTPEILPATFEISPAVPPAEAASPPKISIRIKPAQP